MVIISWVVSVCSELEIENDVNKVEDELVVIVVEMVIIVGLNILAMKFIY